MTRDKWRAWIQASRPPFFVATFIPLGIGWAMAGREGAWRPLWFLAVLVACFMVHLATNLANDFFDHLQGADDGRAIGGSRVIQEGKLSTGELRAALFVLYGLGAVLALTIMVGRSVWGLIPVVALALFSSIFYVAPPVRFGYHALGELFVGLNMGPSMLAGTYWVITGRPALAPFLVSLPVGLMVASILYYQSLPDMETDAAVGKRTLAVRLGKRGAYAGLVLFWVAIWAGIGLLVLMRLLKPWALLGLLSIPLLIRLLAIMRRTADWVELDAFGRYERTLYFVNGLCILIAVI